MLHVPSPPATWPTRWATHGLDPCYSRVQSLCTAATFWLDHHALVWTMHATRVQSSPSHSARLGLCCGPIHDGPNHLNSRVRSTCPSPFQLQLLLLCKCANTTKCTPSCASVLLFSQTFFKGLSLFSPRHSNLACRQS